ncbi:MAG TPA: hypothetical protein VIO60_07025 [Rectinemataceae bacterium]
MNFYRAFGARIRSDLSLPLPEMPADERIPDTSGEWISILEGEAALPYRDTVFTESLGIASYAVEGGLVGIESPRVGRILVRGEDELRFERAEGSDDGMLGSMVIGIAMIFLLKKRGFYTFHGSAAAKDAGAVLFLGEKGGGKSTTVAALTLRGWKSLCNDLALLSPRGDIWPGSPIARLMPDAAAALFGLSGGEHDRYDGVPKRGVALDAQLEPAPLRAICVLRPYPGERLNTLALKGFSKAKAVFPHVCSFKGVDEPETLLALAGRELDGVPVFVLERPIGKDSLNEVLDFIERLGLKG